MRCFGIVVTLVLLGCVNARCSCTFSMENGNSSEFEFSEAFEAATPLKVTEEVSASVSSTEGQVVNVLASANSGNVSKTFEDVVSCSIAFLDDLINNKTPSASEIIKRVAPAIKAVLSYAVDPVVGSIAGFFLSFIEGLFGGTDAELKKLYIAIIAQVQNMIRNAIIANNLKLKSEVLQGFTNLLQNEMSVTVDTVHQGFVIAPLVFDACWTPAFLEAGSDVNVTLDAKTQQDCNTWNDAGGGTLEVQFAVLHMHVMIEMAKNYHAKGDKTSQKKQLATALSNGKNYQALVATALTRFQSTRAHSLQAATFKADGFGNGFDQCLKYYNTDCLTTKFGHDSYSNSNIPGSPTCGYCCCGSTTKLNSWHNLFTQAQTNYQNSINSQIHLIKTQLSGLNRIVSKLSAMKAAGHF